MPKFTGESEFVCDGRCHPMKYACVPSLLGNTFARFLLLAVAFWVSMVAGCRSKSASDDASSQKYWGVSTPVESEVKPEHAAVGELEVKWGQSWYVTTCGAVLVAPNLSVTQAHCIQTPLDEQGAASVSFRVVYSKGTPTDASSFDVDYQFVSAQFDALWSEREHFLRKVEVELSMFPALDTACREFFGEDCDAMGALSFIAMHPGDESVRGFTPRLNLLSEINGLSERLPPHDLAFLFHEPVCKTRPAKLPVPSTLAPVGNVDHVRVISHGLDQDGVAGLRRNAAATATPLQVRAQPASTILRIAPRDRRERICPRDSGSAVLSTEDRVFGTIATVYFENVSRIRNTQEICAWPALATRFSGQLLRSVQSGRVKACKRLLEKPPACGCDSSGYSPTEWCKSLSNNVRGH